METIKDRLKIFAAYMNLSVRAFESSCGLINGYINMLNEAGSGKLAKIHEAYPQLNMDWLLFGEGDMIKSEAVHNTAPIFQGGSNINNTQSGIPAEMLERSQTQLSEALRQNSQLLQIITNLTTRQ